MERQASVLFVTTNLNYNGAKKYIVEVANELIERGHRVGVLYDTGPLAEKLDEQVQKYHVGLYGLGLGPISRIKTILKAAFICEREQYSIIHSEASSSMLSHKLLTFYSKAKVVETIHHAWIKSADRRKAAKQLPRRADLLIAISSSVKKVLGEAGLNLNKVRVLQNGINTKEFAYRDKKTEADLKKSLGIGETDPVLVWVSRISRGKNIEAFINWFPRILANFPKVRFVVVGDNGSGDRKYLDQMIEKIKSVGLSKHIICVGGQTDVKKYLGIGQVFTITALARDLSVMEAMASGLPVVVGRLRYHYKPELVVHGKTGLVFDRGDWRGWVEHIKLLLSDPGVAKRFGDAGKKRVNALFTIEKHVKGLEKVYSSVLEL
jgi:1,2-diacylglycerol 3-alpha-glucosyltransferase